ncbi:MAG: NADH-quinone oxidoreductase subunit NuoH [Anaerolineae bacterium]|nr:NADH-quinone oxidoreductase subunit NuoH [Anaerolineae bacterium]
MEPLTDLLNYLRPSDASTVIECSANSTCTAVHAVAASLIVLLILLTGFAYTTVLERRLIAWIQMRIGPNRAGPLGLLQPVADAVKLIFKQDITPTNADRFVYWLAPVLKVVPTLIVLAVVPLGPPMAVPWIDGNWYRVSLGLVDVNVGVLWLLAITSISVYGVAMAGWASNNKYAMLGSLRSSASMISYELSLASAFVVPVMLAGSLSVGDIIEAQSGNFIFNWYIFQNPVAAVIMLIALFAETNRAPFDLPEAEQELVAGHMTEYSGMKFAMFFMAEYVSMIGVAVIFSSMFLGGYHFILVDDAPWLGPLWLIGKVVAFLAFMVWVRATFTRVRYDRLMTLGWKVMLPLALVSIGYTAVVQVMLEEVENQTLVTAVSVGMLVLLMGVAGAIFLRPRDLTAELETDPPDVVRLDKRGPGYYILQLVGGTLSVPFTLFNMAYDSAANVREYTGTGQRAEPAAERSDDAQLPAPAGSSAPQLGSGSSGD